MPRISRVYLKTALAFLLLGVFTGLHISSAKHLAAGSTHPPYVVAHTHILMIGFFLMSAMGVALWKLPDAPANSRYRVGLAWAVYAMLVPSSIARFLLEIWLGYYPAAHGEPIPSAIFGVSCVQVLALTLFVWNLWPRIRGAQD